MWERLFKRKTTPVAQNNSLVKNRQAAILKIEQHAADRSEKDIQRWRIAIAQAEDIYNPSRLELQSLYNELILDTHLHAQMQLRTLTTTSRKFQLLGNNGEPDKDLTTLFRQSWFYDFIGMALDSHFFGHTLLELQSVENGIPNYKLIQRENVIPERNFIRYDQFLDQGEHFNDNPWIIEIGDKKNLGLLMKTAPHVLYKKNAFQSWAEYTEIFGMPMRWATTDRRDNETLDRLEDSLAQMGEAAYGVFPSGTTLELKESSKGDGFNVYDKLVDRTNSELSKCINSVTMLSDDGSSRSQSQVHLEVGDRITFADGFFIESLINTKVLPQLAKFDNRFINVRFAWDDTIKLPIDLQWGIVESLIAAGYEIPTTWIAETFNIPIEGKLKKTVSQKPEETPPPNFKLARPKSTAVPAIVAAAENNIDKIVDKLIQKVFKQHDFAKNLNSKEFNELIQETTKHLFVGVEKGYGEELVNLDWDTPDAEMLRALRTNIFEFSAFKQAGLLSDLHQLLEKDGRLREWQDFKTEALKKNKLYNKSWLRTEYDQSVAAAQMASKWVSFQDGKDRFYLRYVTVGDELVRKSHDELDGITLPVDHPFWVKNFPPNGWGCRCLVIQVPISSNTITQPKEDLNEPDEGFGFNPGIQQKVLQLEGYKGRLPKEFVNRVMSLVTDHASGMGFMLGEQNNEIADFANSIAKKIGLNKTLKAKVYTDNSYGMAYNGVDTVLVTNANIGSRRAKLNPYTTLQSAMDNIKKGKTLSKKEETAFCMFWHEINHARATYWKTHKPNESDRKIMETLNEWYSRWTYPDVLQKLGVKAGHQSDIQKKAYGYQTPVENLINLMNETGVRSKELKLWLDKNLLVENYEGIAERASTLIEHKGVEKEDAKKLIQYLFDTPSDTYKKLLQTI